MRKKLPSVHHHIFLSALVLACMILSTCGHTLAPESILEHPRAPESIREHPRATESTREHPRASREHPESICGRTLAPKNTPPFSQLKVKILKNGTENSRVLSGALDCSRVLSDAPGCSRALWGALGCSRMRSAASACPQLLGLLIPGWCSKQTRVRTKSDPHHCS